jgi:hypothetical protein
MGQSSNDTFPTAMHIAAYKMATEKTIPALKRLRDALDAKSKQWSTIVKIGRTHLEDATPLTVGQEWSGYVGALDDAIADVDHATQGLLQVAMGGTAVGTGLNSPVGFGDAVAAELTQLTGFAIKTATNKFTAQGTLDRGVKVCRRFALQDRQRHALAWLRPTHGPHGDDLSLERARLVDHAGQGQPDPGRGHAHGVYPDHGFGCRSTNGGIGGQF